jgi:dATP pyrophosphohydrolase
MARTPNNVLVLPFRRRADASVEFAVFLRADQAGEVWQGVAGGVEDGESLLEAARREFAEETGIEAAAARWLLLDTRASVPAAIFQDSARWGADTYVVTEHAFAVEVGGESDVRLSHEHSECRWLDLAAASSLVRYDSNRTALWELSERLTRAKAR